MIRSVVLLCASLSYFASACLAEDAAEKPKYPRVIVGKVKDVEGKPIKGARVEYGYFSAKAADREFVLTDADGLYRLETNQAGRDFRVGVSAQGYAPHYVDGLVPGPADEPTEHSVKLDSGVSLSLRITTRSGKPLKNLQVRPTTPSSGFYSSFSSPTPNTPLPGDDRVLLTDADGRVTFESLPQIPASPYAKDFPVAQRRPTPWLGFKVIRKDDNSHQHYGLSAEEVAKAKPGEPVVIKVSDYLDDEPRDGVIKGRVVDQVSGDPIRDFVVVRRYSTKAESFSHADGRFTSGGELRPGRAYETRVFAPGYAVTIARPVANVGAAIREQKFELEKYPSFYGRLVDTDGNPLSGVELVTGVAPEGRRSYVEWSTLDSYADGHHSLENVLRVKTNEKGEFVIPEAPNKGTTVIVKAPGHARQVIMPANRPKADENGIVTIALQKAAKLIAVADRNTQLGQLADGVSLGFRSDDGFEHMYHSSELDGSGMRVYESMAPGDYSVSLYSRNGDTHYPCYSKTVTLKAGEETRVALGRMFGTFTLSGDAPPFSTVRINGRALPKGPSSFAVHADVDGVFELRGLLPGEYSLATDLSSSSRGYHGGRGPARTVQLTEDKYVDLRLPAIRLKSPN